MAAIAALTLATSIPAASQTFTEVPVSRRDTLIVMTVPLKHLTSSEAVMLLAPYATSMGGAVYPVPNGHSVTIRERVPQYARMLKVLEENDRSTATIAFTFQVVSANNSGKRSPELASLDSALRSVLKYSGYFLLGVGTATTNENTPAASEVINVLGQQWRVSFSVADVRTIGTASTVKLQVRLSQGIENASPEMFSTGLTVPIGQTVVVGSVSYEHGEAIMLTVRPQLVNGPLKARDD